MGLGRAHVDLKFRFSALGISGFLGVELGPWATNLLALEIPQPPKALFDEALRLVKTSNTRVLGTRRPHCGGTTWRASGS